MWLSYAKEILSIPSIIFVTRREGGPFWGSGGLRGSAIVPFERAMAVFYRLSIV